MRRLNTFFSIDPSRLLHAPQLGAVHREFPPASFLDTMRLETHDPWWFHLRLHRNVCIEVKRFLPSAHLSF